MRIGLVIYGSLDTLSGGYLYDRRLVYDLRQQGHTVDIISLPWRGYLRNLADNLWPALEARLRRHDLAVLLQDELNHPSLWWVNRRIKRDTDYPIISIVHHLRISELRAAWQNRLYRFVERAYLASVDGFVFNSQTTRQSVEQLVGDVRPAVVAVPAGDRLQPSVSPAEIIERAQQPGPLRILFVGNLIARKGLHTLLSAVARLDPQTWQLTVVGSQTVDPGYTAGIRRQIQQLGLGDRVRLLGSLSDTVLATNFARHHLLVVPSTYEGYGIVYVEAMGFGLPVIASSAGAAGEVIDHGRNGYLVTPQRHDELAAHLRRLTLDRSLLIALGQAAQRRYARHPTWSQTTAEINSFLTTIARAWPARHLSE